jgi:serine/threonine protein kinase
MSTPQQTQAAPLQLQAPTATGACGETWRGTLAAGALTRPVRVQHIRDLPGGLEGTQGVRLREELARLSRLQHRAVVPIQAVHIQGTRVLLVSERIAGIDLAHLLHAHGPLRPRAVCQILAEVAAALGAAHRLRLTHRNLRPTCILLTESGDVRVQDFGLAAVLCSGLDTPKTIRLNAAHYMAPERLQGRGAGWAQDTYALGMIGLTCLLGGLPVRLPFPPVQRLAVLKAALAERGDLPLELTELLGAMIAQRPADRPSALEVAHHARRMIAESPGQWLEDLAPRVVPAALEEPRPDPVAIPPRRRRRFGVVLVGLLLIGGGGGMTLLLGALTLFLL